MNRIIFLLLLAFISGATLAQPSKGKKKATSVKTNNSVQPSTQEQEEKGAINIMVAKARSVIEKMTEKTSPPSDSSALDSGELSLRKAYQPYGWVNDFTNLFTTAQQTELDSLITAFEKATTVEMAIVTIDSTVTSRKGFDNYITALGNRWGVGKQETNNGIIIGICPSYKRIRISTGPGIMDKWSDATVKSIIDNTIIPQYKQGAYFEGTKMGLLAVMQELRSAD